MNGTHPDEEPQPGDPDEEELLALDAYIDAYGTLGPSVDPTVPPVEPALEEMVDRLRSLSEAAWDDAVPLVAPRPSEPPATGRRVRGRPSAARILVVAAVAVVVVVAAVAIATLSGQPPLAVKHIHGAAASWRLSGYIDQPTWLNAGTAAGSSATVTCPVVGVCYGDAPGPGVSSTSAEVTTDGGSSWRAVPLPAGTLLTSGLACPSTDQCMVGGYVRAVAGSGAPAGGSPSILATADGGATWSVEALPPGVAEVTDLACTSRLDCTGAGYGPATATDPQGAPLAVVTGDGGRSWLSAALPATFTPFSPDGLSCAGPRSCALVGATDSTAPAGSSQEAGAAVYTIDGGQSWSPADVPSGVAQIRAVSCSDGSSCVAVASTTAHPAGWTVADPYGPSESLTSIDGGQTWSAARSAGLIPSTLTSISCPTASDCWAAGSRPASASSGSPGGVIVATHDAGAGWTTEQLPTKAAPAQQSSTQLLELDIEDISSVSCPAVDACLAVGSQGSAVTPAEQQIVVSNAAG